MVVVVCSPLENVNVQIFQGVFVFVGRFVCVCVWESHTTLLDLLTFHSLKGKTAKHGDKQTKGQAQIKRLQFSSRLLTDLKQRFVLWLPY